MLHCILDDGEFVAADARNGVADTDAAAQPPRHGLQQSVADLVAEHVVDVLEVVEIEIKHRELLAALDGVQCALQPLLQQDAVRQIGQRVMSAHMHDLFLGLAALSDVFVGRDPAAARHWNIHDPDDAAVGQFEDAIDLGSEPDRCHHALIIFLRVAPEGLAGFAQTQEIEDREPDFELAGREEIHLLEALVPKDELALRVEHQQGLRHIVDGDVKAEVLRAQLLLARLQRHGAFLDHPFETAVELVQFLDHQRDRAVGAAAVAIRLVVSFCHEGVEHFDVELARRLGCLRKLPREKSVLLGHAASHSVVTVMVWL